MRASFLDFLEVLINKININIFFSPRSFLLYSLFRSITNSFIFSVYI